MNQPESVIDIETLLDSLQSSLQAVLTERRISNPAMIGIHTGGAWIAEKLHQRMALSDPLGSMDISFYRDDFSQIGMHPEVKPSHLPFNVENRDIILVDDVLYTGRTIRAALNEIFDYGRPASVTLAVLVERNGRQIPVQADSVGTRISLPPGQRITLQGPEPLQMNIHIIEN